MIKKILRMFYVSYDKWINEMRYLKGQIIDERKEYIKSERLCYNYFSKGHNVKDYKWKCSIVDVLTIVTKNTIPWSILTKKKK